MSRDLYQLPEKPGNVGGYRVAGIVSTISAFLLGNLAATEYMAYGFRFHPSLGTPLYTYSGYAIYHPFKWMFWTVLNIFHPNPAVHHMVMVSAGIVCGSIVFGILLGCVLQSRTLRKAEKGTDDLHGSAKWASRRDIEQTGLVQAQHGVYVGGWQDGGKLRYLKHNGPEHVLAFAPTRSGKGVGLVLPTLLAWTESAVIYDIKGENWHLTAGFRSTLGPVFKFSPAEADSSRFNPLAEIRLWTAYDVKDAQNIAELIVKPFGEVNHEHGYFFAAAKTLLTSVILHCCYAAERRGMVASLGDVQRGFNVEGGELGETYQEVLKSLTTATHAEPDHVWPDGSRGKTHPQMAMMAREIAEKIDRNFDGVLSTARTAVELWYDPLVLAATSASDFRVDNLVNFEQPVSLYMIVPASDRNRLRPLIRLMFALIVDRLTERLDFDEGTQKKNRHRLLLMADEFPTLGSMQAFSDGLAYMAGFGIKAYLICQDLVQLKASYGQYQSIVSNCGIQIAYAPNTEETARLLSDTLGRQTVARTRHSFSRKMYAPVSSNVSEQVEYSERPLLAPDEFRRLEGPKMSEDGTKIVAPGKMVVFVAGKRPVKGTQMLYFLDPEFKRRSQIEPPEDRVMIYEGEVHPQPPLNRTLNVLSRIEPEPPEEEETTEDENAIVTPW